MTVPISISMSPAIQPPPQAIFRVLTGRPSPLRGGGESDALRGPTRHGSEGIETPPTSAVGGEDVGCDLAINPETDNVYIVGVHGFGRFS